MIATTSPSSVCARPTRAEGCLDSAVRVPSATPPVPGVGAQRNRGFGDVMGIAAWRSRYCCAVVGVAVGVDRAAAPSSTFSHTWSTTCPR